MHYPTKDLRPKRRHIAQEPVEICLTTDDIDFLTGFVNSSAFYIEDLEEEIGEPLNDFWHQRDHALRILTELILQASFDSDVKLAHGVTFG